REPDLCATMGHAARRRATEFSWENYRASLAACTAVAIGGCTYPREADAFAKVRIENQKPDRVTAVTYCPRRTHLACEAGTLPSPAQIRADGRVAVRSPLSRQSHLLWLPGENRAPVLAVQRPL